MSHKNQNPTHNPKPLLSCPNCQANWDEEEIDMQQCDACGYPLNQDTDEDEDEGDYFKW